MDVVRLLVALGLAALPAAAPVAGQGAGSLTAERQAFQAWLRTAPNSPFAALAQRPIGPGLMLGPRDADIPLDGIAPARVREGDRLPVLETGGRTLPLPPGRLVAHGRYRLTVGGIPGRRTLTVFDQPRNPNAPVYYPEEPRFALVVTLVPPARAGTQRILGLDGIEATGTDAGTVRVAFSGAAPATLRVLRVPIGPEESDLEIFFRDQTNGRGTYPAGRFVILTPRGGDQYLLDFNRARNPFCAYSTVYACPAPWRGNTLDVAITAGERYTGGGLEIPGS